MAAIDLVVFVGFIVAVIGIGLWKSRDEKSEGEKGAADYFLAGRGLTWWLVGFSLIAANISTEQFVGMSGSAANWLGMAIASYEWMAAITLVVVAFVFLPTFLKSGIYTIPEFLEYRYNAFARTVMAVFSLLVLVLVPTVTVIFSGAKVITANFQGLEWAGIEFGNVTHGCYLIGTLGAIYVFAGGLKACAWADVIQGAALVIGGAIIAWSAFAALDNADPADLIQTARSSEVTVEEIAEASPIERFVKLNEGDLPEGKLHMVRGVEDPEIPWTALVVGLWIPNFFYWGLNQYITQRTLGSKSLAEGQRGVVFAAFLKLIIPFVVVIPGILAYNLFSGDLQTDAINRNALVVAKNSPDFYATLPDAVKPADDAERNGNLLDRIQGYLDSTEAAAKPTVYGFEEAYAELYPDAAERFVDHNRSVLGDVATDEDAGGLAATAAAQAAVAGRDTESYSVETLVDHDYDNAFPTLIRELLPKGNGLKGFVLAAMFGAVVSSLASMLNSASTIATMDLYRKIAPGASQASLVAIGRFFIVLFVGVAMYLAPMLQGPELGGVFKYVQEFQGFISPGILAIFLFGLLVHRAPRMVGTVGLALNPFLYGYLKVYHSEMAFLNRMAICFGVILAVLAVLTALFPLKEPVELPVNEEMDVTGSPGAKLAGIGVVVLTLVLYAVFW
ncbi:Sodium/glucose cotransporter [Pseudobythopirellula maris]|uniref:Sodium/glucose cotransporter n=1 Tax=Pseudobythopirellula maris TaxID=2527991 RepID=A0A5C5ZTD0_9BACT|nr:sodium/solute symporter [Pseudobythopirellula maris]TWT90804.1 Sodium/glucose cotransporter [Pseudobythopirellula maris]